MRFLAIEMPALVILEAEKEMAVERAVMTVVDAGKGKGWGGIC